MKKSLSALIYLFIAIFVTGCEFSRITHLTEFSGLTQSQIFKTQSFGTATANVGQLTETEFINIRNGVIQMNKELLTLNQNKTSNIILFDKPTFAEPTSTRVAASQAIKLYGELLVKLVSENRTENLQKSATDLINNSSVALKNNLSAEKKNAIRTVIVDLGSFWVEKKKADAAKQIILTYQESVNQLADLLNQDFSLDDESLGYLKAYNTTAKRLKNTAMRLVNAEKLPAKLSRQQVVSALMMAEKAINRSTELSKKATQAIIGLKNANTELVSVLTEENYPADEDIKTYILQIQELINMYQVLGH